MKKATLGAVGALLAVGALMALGAGGAASASTADKARAAVITMEQDGRELSFNGPDTVKAGATLKIKNKTDPAKVGPHTFSLVREQDLPATDKQIKKCERDFKKICGAIIRWHDVNLDTGEIGVNPVEVGKEGWDRKGSLKRTGDSWATERENQSFKREVTAPSGKTLWFICAVHAGMQGEIEVTD